LLNATKSAGDYDSDNESQSSFAAKDKFITPRFKLDSLTFSPLKMASFSTNPYNNFQAANSKEYISLDKVAKHDFKPETHFDLIPGNSNSFLAEIEQFGYGTLLNVPTACDVDSTDANAITYKDPVNMTETWNKINDKLIARSANEVWGTHDWTVSTTKQIEAMTGTCGKCGTANALTKISKKKFMEPWKSTILAARVMALLTPEAQNPIKIHKKAYQWTDPISDKIVTNGHSLRNEVLKLMRPDVQTNVYAELAKIKAIKPSDYGFDVVKCHAAMELECISIEQKVPSAYHESQFIMDYLNIICTVDVKSLQAEVYIIQNKYLRGNPKKWNASYICGEIIKTYNNMSEDGTWKKELGEKDQIIALSTKVAELRSKLNKQVIALATQENKEVTPDAGGGGGGSCRGKRDGPYTPAWCLIKKEDKVINNGKEYYWCTGVHYSGGVKHNGMYADHKTCNHNEWRYKMDEHCTSRNKGKKPNKTPAKPANDSNQKLTLNDKLCSAFCTQAGLSAEAVDRIWEEAEDAQGNK
jgi:hypothetical protein